MKHLATLSITLALLLAAAPVRAAEAPEWRVSQATPLQVAPKERRDPWLGVGLTVGAPLAIALAGYALHQSQPGVLIDNRWSTLDATMVVVPLGLSAGYFYAGEPADGLLVGLVGSAAMATGTYFARGGTVSGQIDPASASIWPLVAASGLALVAGAFAVSDVRDLITQKNKER